MKNVIAFLIMVAIVCTLEPLVHAQEHVLEKHTILVYGLPPEPVYTNAQNVVAQRWGLEFKAVAGCVVTEEFIDSVAQVNSKTDAILVRKYGEDWRDRFDEEVEAEYAREKNVIQILKADTGYQHIWERYHPDSYAIFRLTPVMGTAQYDVQVSITSGTEEKSTGYRYRVDYTTRSVQKR